MSDAKTTWAEAFETARRWVADSARKRWPAYPVNDDVWAMSAAAWTLGRHR